MKNILRTIAVFAAMVAALHGVVAQNTYWVFLADKAGTTFDPYSYFDAKAIERYNQCGANLYDISNYPLNSGYTAQVAALATDEVGSSRWLNAMAVDATESQAEAIAQLPFVTRVVMIASTNGMQPATSYKADSPDPTDQSTQNARTLTPQLTRMQGEAFRAKGIDGHGVRVAVFDGGFPRVNTHAAFKHLRDEGRIVKTWNFCNRIENVYGWNSHGTMTLSCIAGREGDKDLGLATGAEYLLARTEVELEPAKEEVWWMQAMEWADQNGAQIISSSLGYGKERYYTRDMDGTSLVARAANMAARKGILVCNSAGNEATDRQWRTIITPADADSVLCVGGIVHSLEQYRHISFSSYGPTADGRQKPNVVAFGHARTANITGDEAYHYVDGTSFSCPLVAGFAACAIQAMPGKNAMQMIDELQRSADLYPYCDYAFGYGVPQATYFTGSPRKAEPTFRFEENGTDSVYVMPYTALKKANLFYRFVQPDGQIAHYGQYELDELPEGKGISFCKAAVFNRTLDVNLNGYTASYRLPQDEQSRYDSTNFYYSPKANAGVVGNLTLARNGAEANKTSVWGGQSPLRYDLYLQYGISFKTRADETAVDYSDAVHLGGRLLCALGKAYCLGLGLEWGSAEYNLPEQGTTRQSITLSQWSLELFQRVRFVPGGQITGRGIYWDLGIYGTMANNRMTTRDGNGTDGTATWRRSEQTLHGLSTLDHYRWQYGVTTRFGYSLAALYARYNLSSLLADHAAGDIILPRLEVGLQIAF
ncbi:MAG: S8 family serine peptidase [Bacteroidales bacterium]|nr:S8 family serine peptidase [Bacteroidales bacterium]